MQSALSAIRFYFTANLDYIHFFYGLMCLLMAAVCFLLHRRKDKAAPWLWLALFGEIHGLNEWLYMLSLSLPETIIPWWFMVFLAAVSFSFLTIFGQRSLLAHGRRWAKPWLWVALIVLALPGLLEGDVGFNAMARHMLAFVGGLMASRGLMLASAEASVGRRSLRAAAIALGLFAAASGLVVHQTSFPPASIFNTELFFRLTALSIQFVRAILAMIMALGLWTYFMAVSRSRMSEAEQAAARRFSVTPAVLLFALLIGGWFLTRAIGSHFENTTIHADILARAQLISKAIGERKIGKVTAKPVETAPNTNARLAEKLKELCASQKETFYLYLVTPNQGQPVFLMDCCLHQDHDCLRSSLRRGDPLPNPLPELMHVMNGETSTGLAQFQVGENGYLTAFIPVILGGGERPYAVLGAEMNTKVFRPQVSEARLAPMAVTLLACLMLITFFYAYQGIQASAGQVFAAEQVKKDAEEKLRESNERYRMLFEESPYGVVLLDPENKRPVEFNAAACRQLGYTQEEYAELSINDWEAIERPEETEARVAQIVREGRAEFETVHRTKTGDLRNIHICVRRIQIDGRPYMLTVHRDVTELKRAEEERRRLEAQVLHAQKLESLGVLAGGIAHDFNNLLMGIMGYAEIGRSEIPEFSPARRSLEQIEKAAQRAADLTRQMLAYSGRGQFVVRKIVLNELVEEISHLLKVSISKKCSIELDFARELPPIQCDPTQIRQVLMNLITNASDAIGEDPGTIRIRTGVRRPDREYFQYAWLNEDLPDGDYVMLEVSDTGCGMDEEIQAKIFDPFFTTKFTGRGLGLAAVLGIVRGHKGAIRIQSAVGRGTTFTILLPCAEDAAEAQPAPSEPARPARSEPGHRNGTVLIVDDDPAVRSLASTILIRNGYAILTATDGRDGVEIFRTHRGEIGCVLLDMTMPHMDGEEAYRTMRAMRADVRVILSSGYSEQEAMKRFADKGLAGFIQKPYRAADLVETIRRVLNHN